MKMPGNQARRGEEWVACADEFTLSALAPIAIEEWTPIYGGDGPIRDIAVDRASCAEAPNSALSICSKMYFFTMEEAA
jgi:hypothetical protein